MPSVNHQKETKNICKGISEKLAAGRPFLSPPGGHVAKYYWSQWGHVAIDVIMTWHYRGHVAY